MSAFIYGLKNCDACRKAKSQLRQQGVEAEIIDLRESGVDPDQLQDWARRFGWDVLVNRRSRTWKELSEAERTAEGDKALTKLVLLHPTLVKRPIVDWEGKITLGLPAE